MIIRIRIAAVPMLIKSTSFCCKQVKCSGSVLPEDNRYWEGVTAPSVTQNAVSDIFYQQLHTIRYNSRMAAENHPFTVCHLVAPKPRIPYGRIRHRQSASSVCG
jgi:hypothetical protein